MKGTQKAEILIGRYSPGAWEGTPVWEDYFSLHIGNRLIASRQSSLYEGDSYLHNCREAARDFFRVLKKRDIKGFILLNGTRAENGGRVECSKIPLEGIVRFEMDDGFPAKRKPKTA